MAYTTISAGTIGIADGDQSPSPVDGTVRITPRFPSAATDDGLIATGPVVVEVAGGAMPKTDVPALTDATALVEFHLYDRNAGPVHLPATEIPLEPSTTINLRDYLAVAVDPATGGTLVRGPRGRGITSVSGSDGNIIIEWEDGAESAAIPMPDAIEGPRGPEGPQGDKGDSGDVRFDGVSPSITVRTDDVLIGDTAVAATSYVDAGRWMAGEISASEDLNYRESPGTANTFSIASTVVNKPSWATGNPFTVEVWRGSGARDPVLYQRFTQGDAYGLNAAIRYRHGSVWRDWVDLLPDESGPWYRGSITSSDTLDNLPTGLYYVFTSNTNAVLGLPEGTPGGPVQIVRQGAAGGHLVLETATTPMKRWGRIRTGSGWGPPQLLNPDPEPAPVIDYPEMKHQLLVEDFSRRRGGWKWTDVGCVALRFDHGLDKFNRLIRPHLERLGLPHSLVLNSRDWDREENAGVDASMVNSWVQAGLAEVWNHGAVHVGSLDEETWRDYIIGGRDELAAQMPAASIDGFAIPGTGSTGYGDFNAGASLDEFSDTPAGRLLLATHAIVTGAIPSSADIPLDGKPRTGINHTGFGSTDLSSFQSAVNSIASRVVGRVFMMHPSQMETDGYDTEADFAAKLEWLAAERDAGRVKVVGHYDLHLHVRVPNP